MNDKNSPQGQDETNRREAPAAAKTPACVKLVVEIDPGKLTDAERLIADHARATLEEVLAGLVADMAEAWDRPGSWEAAAVCGWMSSHPWPRRSAETEGEDL